jgi:hypothetical protein
VASEILGHSNVAITRNVYSHALPSMQEEATQTVADKLFGTGGRKPVEADRCESRKLSVGGPDLANSDWRVQQWSWTTQ